MCEIATLMYGLGIGKGLVYITEINTRCYNRLLDWHITQRQNFHKNSHYEYNALTNCKFVVIICKFLPRHWNNFARINILTPTLSKSVCQGIVQLRTLKLLVTKCNKQ